MCSEQLALERLREEIPMHSFGGAVFDGSQASLHRVSNKEVSNVHVTSLFAAGFLSVPLQEDTALVILMDDIVLIDRSPVGHDRSAEYFGSNVETLLYGDNSSSTDQIQSMGEDLEEGHWTWIHVQDIPNDPK